MVNQNSNRLQTSMQNNFETSVQNWKSMCAVNKTLVEGIQMGNKDTQDAINSFKKQQSDNFEKLQINTDRLSKNNLENISNMSAVIETSLQSVKTEIQGLQNNISGNLNKIENVELRISESLENVCENNSKNISNIIRTSMASAQTANDNSQVTIIREIQSQRSEIFLRFMSLDQQISKITDLIKTEMKSSMEGIFKIEQIVVVI
jgi:hypothetical protein